MCKSEGICHAKIRYMSNLKRCTIGVFIAEKKPHGAATAFMTSHFFLKLIGKQEDDTGFGSRRTPRGDKRSDTACASAAGQQQDKTRRTS